MSGLGFGLPRWVAVRLNNRWISKLGQEPNTSLESTTTLRLLESEGLISFNMGQYQLYFCVTYLYMTLGQVFRRSVVETSCYITPFTLNACFSSSATFRMSFG